MLSARRRLCASASRAAVTETRQAVERFEKMLGTSARRSARAAHEIWGQDVIPTVSGPGDELLPALFQEHSARGVRPAAGGRICNAGGP